MVLIMEYCNGGELFNKICAESEDSFRQTMEFRTTGRSESGKWSGVWSGRLKNLEKGGR